MVTHNFMNVEERKHLSSGTFCGTSLTSSENLYIITENSNIWGASTRMSDRQRAAAERDERLNPLYLIRIILSEEDMKYHSAKEKDRRHCNILFIIYNR